MMCTGSKQTNTKHPQSQPSALGLLTCTIALLSCGTEAIGSPEDHTTELAAVSAVIVTPDTVSLSAIGATLQLSATARDADGNTIAGREFSWESSNPTVLTVDLSGSVTAKENGTSTITASAEGVSGTAFVEVKQEVSKLAFATEPTNVPVGERLQPAIQVVLLDELGSQVFTATDSVTVALDANADRATLWGTITVAAAAGLATFDDLLVDRSGDGYTLVATANSESTTSTPFDVEPSLFAYVANNAEKSVSVVRLPQDTIVATVNVGVRPYGLAATPDGAFVYVTEANENTVSVIETSGNTVVATIGVGEAPRGLAITPDGASTYVTHGSLRSPYVAVIGTARYVVVDSIDVTGGNETIAITPDGESAYLTSGGDVVEVIELATNRVVSRVGVGRRPRGIAMTPDGASVYVANSMSATLSVINTDNNTVVDSIEMGLYSPVRLAITPDGQFVYVTHSPWAEFVSVVETESNTVITTVEIGGVPFGVAATPDGTRVYVTHDPSNVSVIDIATNTVVKTVEVGFHPIDVAVVLKSYAPRPPEPRD